MKKFIIFITLLSVFAVNAQQKDVPFEKGNFKDKAKKAGFKDAQKNFEQGNDAYYGTVTGYPQFHKAIEFYEKAHAYNPNSADLNFRLGVSHLNNLEKMKALDFLQKAYALKPTVDPKIHFYIGLAYQLRSVTLNAHRRVGHQVITSARYQQPVLLYQLGRPLVCDHRIGVGADDVLVRSVEHPHCLELRSQPAPDRLSFRAQPRRAARCRLLRFRLSEVYPVRAGALHHLQVRRQRFRSRSSHTL